MHFLVPGNFLHIKGKVQQRPKYYKSDEFQKEYRIQQIDVLDDIRDKLSNSLYLKWDYESLKTEQINELEKLMGKYKGKKQIIFELLDSESSSYVTLNSRKFMSNVSNELLHEISQLDGFLGYSINKSNMVNYLEKNNH
jgi:hypothetical protein